MATTMPRNIKVHLAIFASGGGSNAQQICSYFSHHPLIDISLIVTNNPNAGVLKVADAFGIPSFVLSKEKRSDKEYMFTLLKQHHVDYIILAGYLLLIPDWLIARFHNKILNIHPSLLPKYGGKGMYGHHVHQAVYDHRDTISGMTIHVVNEEFDKGEILFQKSVAITEDMMPNDIATAVLRLEHRFYSEVIEKYITSHL